MRKILLKPNGIKLSTDKVIYLNRSVAVTDLNKINYNHDIKKIGTYIKVKAKDMGELFKEVVETLEKIETVKMHRASIYLENDYEIDPSYVQDLVDNKNYEQLIEELVGEEESNGNETERMLMQYMVNDKWVSLEVGKSLRIEIRTMMDDYREEDTMKIVLGLNKLKEILGTTESIEQTYEELIISLDKEKDIREKMLEGKELAKKIRVEFRGKTTLRRANILGRPTI
jgi:hypothetical protein